MFYNGKIINNNYFNNYQEFQYLLNPKCIYTINESNSGVNSLLLIDKFKLCASYDDGLIKIFDLNNYNCLYILEGHSSPVLSISLMLNKKGVIIGFKVIFFFFLFLIFFISSSSSLTPFS